MCHSKSQSVILLLVKFVGSLMAMSKSESILSPNLLFLNLMNSLTNFVYRNEVSFTLKYSFEMKRPRFKLIPEYMKCALNFLFKAPLIRANTAPVFKRS